MSAFWWSVWRGWAIGTIVGLVFYGIGLYMLGFPR